VEDLLLTQAEAGETVVPVDQDQGETAGEAEEEVEIVPVLQTVIRITTAQSAVMMMIMMTNHDAKGSDLRSF
jgi:hypothetical protein